MDTADTKIQLLSSALSKLQRPGSVEVSHAHNLARTIAIQGLLSSPSAGNDEDVAEWSKAVSTWFQYLLEQLTHEQVAY